MPQEGLGSPVSQVIQEATTSFLHVPFDIGSVRRLVEFMYTGDYQLSPDPALELLSSDASDNSSKHETGKRFETSRDLIEDDRTLCQLPIKLPILPSRIRAMVPTNS